MAQIQPSEQPTKAQTKVAADKAQLAADEAEAQLAADEAKTETASGPFYYCMEENHPGSPNFQTQPLSVARIFQSNEDVPVCPACQRQVNAVVADGPDIPPEFVQDLQRRFGR